MTDKTLLDIDDTILTKKLLLSEYKYEYEMDDILKQRLEERPKYILIHPSPGVCVKTKTVTGEKVFLNICTSPKIPEPKDISLEELIADLSKDSTDYSIPMSIGEERFESDKGGTLCVTHDVTINNNYFEKCQMYSCFWTFTISVIMEGVSHKFGRTLDLKTCIVLKNRKVMGTIQPQRIDDREGRNSLPPTKSPLIQEISSSSASAQPQSNLEELTTKDYVILKEPLEGTARRLIGLFRIPKGVPSEDVNVFVSTDRLLVTTSNNDFVHDVSIPHTIKLDETECFFDKDLKVLRLNMLIESKETETQ